MQPPSYDVVMVPFTIELDDDAAEQLRRRAEREGVAPAKLAARLLNEAAGEPDPFEFVGSFASDVLGARRHFTVVRPKRVAAFDIYP
jgi:hypothetical protein